MFSEISGVCAVGEIRCLLGVRFLSEYFSYLVILAYQAKILGYSPNCFCYSGYFVGVICALER